MSRTRHAARTAAVSATAVLLGVGLAGCGGGEKPATKGPASATPTSASPTPTPSASASPTPTTVPLSRFEDEPLVKAARAWAVAYATDINNQDQNNTEIKKLGTAHANANAGFYEKTDLSQKGMDPGPTPFTPTSVKAGGGNGSVVGCMQFDGWAINRKTKQPIDAKRTVRPFRMVFKKEGGQWKFDDLQTTSAVQCSDVVVKGVPFS